MYCIIALSRLVGTQTACGRILDLPYNTQNPVAAIPIICQGSLSVILIDTQLISNYVFYTNETMYLEVSDGVVVGSVHQTTATAGAQCELPCLVGGNSQSDAAFTFCPDIRVHWLPRCYGEARAAPVVGLCAAGGMVICWCKNHLFFLRTTDRNAWTQPRFPRNSNLDIDKS